MLRFRSRLERPCRGPPGVERHRGVISGFQEPLAERRVFR